MDRMRYLIVGRGKWGRRMAGALEARGSPHTCANIPRRDLNPADPAYLEYAKRYLGSAGEGVDIVWLITRPGDHQTALARAALSLGKNVLVEKPWMVTEDEARELAGTASQRGLLIGVHFQYCFLNRLVELSRLTGGGQGFTFSGTFTTMAEDRFGIPAAYNLGSHLIAIWLRHFPRAALGTLITAFQTADRRDIRLVSEAAEHAYSFTTSNEPLVDRFLCAFEDAAAHRQPFGLDVRFCWRVNSAISRQGGDALSVGFDLD